MEYQYDLLAFHEAQERLDCLLSGKKFKHPGTYRPPWVDAANVREHRMVGRTYYNLETKEWEFNLHGIEDDYSLPHEQPMQWPIFVEKCTVASYQTADYARKHLKYYFKYSSRI